MTVSALLSHGMFVDIGSSYYYYDVTLLVTSIHHQPRILANKTDCNAASTTKEHIYWTIFQLVSTFFLQQRRHRKAYLLVTGFCTNVINMWVS